MVPRESRSLERSSFIAHHNERLLGWRVQPSLGEHLREGLIVLVGNFEVGVDYPDALLKANSEMSRREASEEPGIRQPMEIVRDGVALR